MGQGDMLKILNRKKYKDGLTIREISRLAKQSKSSTSTNLRKLREKGEIKFTYGVKENKKDNREEIIYFI